MERLLLKYGKECLGLDKRINPLYLICHKLVWTRSDATMGPRLTETYEESLFGGGLLFMMANSHMAQTLGKLQGNT